MFELKDEKKAAKLVDLLVEMKAEQSVPRKVDLKVEKMVQLSDWKTVED
jgi:hypothetical protein